MKLLELSINVLISQSSSKVFEPRTENYSQGDFIKYPGIWLTIIALRNQTQTNFSRILQFKTGFN